MPKIDPEYAPLMPFFDSLEELANHVGVASVCDLYVETDFNQPDPGSGWEPGEVIF